MVNSIGSLAAVICGGDSGVKATDALSEALDLRGNGHGNRRDKLLQQQALKAAGLRFARTVSGTTWEQAGENVVLGPLHDVFFSMNLTCSKSRNSRVFAAMFLFGMEDFCQSKWGSGRCIC